VIRIRPQWSKRLRETGIPRNLLAAGDIASAYADQVRHRVKRRGQVVNPHGRKRSFRYSNKRGKVPYIVNEDYARAAGTDETLSLTSSEWHKAAGVKPGTFDTTGGMWKGLQVNAVGRRAAKVFFGKSTIGKDSKAKTDKAGNAKRFSSKTGRRLKPRNVRNRDKAARVLRSSGVNVLQWTRGELDAMGRGVADGLRLQFAAALGVSFPPFATAPRDAVLYRRIRARMRLHRSG